MISLLNRLRRGDTGRQGRNVLLHCHFFKNAGTTIDDALQRVYGEAFYDHRDDRVMRKQGMSCVEAFLEEHVAVRALSSHHMPFSPEHASEKFAFRYIVMLREPIDRAGSVHAFEVKQGEGSRGARMAQSADAREYFEWRLGEESPAVMRSFQARYLADKRRPKMPMTDEVLQRACERLAHPAVSFGVVERFDESMVVMEQSLRKDFPDLDLAHVVRNRNRTGSVESRREALRELVGEPLFERLQAANAHDIELHRHANEMLDSVIENIDDFEARLADYRRRCDAL